MDVANPPDAAQKLLDAGLTVREVAIATGVTTQAIYKRLKAGTLTRPGVGR